MKTFLRILDISIKRNGPDKVLTLSHLRNLCNLAELEDKKESESVESMLEEVEGKYWADVAGYGES